MSTAAIRIGKAFSIAWLLLLIPSIPEVARTAPDDLAVTVVVLAAFAAIYASVFLFVVWAPPVPTSVPLSAWAAMTLIATYLAFVRPGHFAQIYIFAAVVAGAALPLRVGLAATAVDFALTVGGFLVGGSAVLNAVTNALETPLFAVGAAAVAQVISSNVALRRARDEIARLAVQEERLRVARDLHDLLGRSLSVVALKSELAGRLLAVDPERAAVEVRDVERIAREALRQVREAVAGYRQPTLALELAGARAALDAAGIECCVDQAAGALPRDVEAILAWTVREGVTNVIRHSGAKRCDIRLTQRGGQASLVVVDDGRGAAAGASGSGLRGLAERVAEGGGAIEAGAHDRAGFLLAVSLPLDRAAEGDA